MNEKQILAYMYDFYNSHVLKGQNDDIGYYIKYVKENKIKKTLVVGAGTWRVAIPLSKYCSVTAIDMDKERLRILSNKSKNIKIYVCNFIDSIPSKNYDLIIFPYSTFQYNGTKKNMINMAKKLFEYLNNNTVVLIDFSESFNTKDEKSKEFIFKDYDKKYDTNINVYFESKRRKKYIEFDVTYSLDDLNISVLEIEKYYYYDETMLKEIFRKIGIDIIKIDFGYKNDNSFNHKHIFHLKKLISKKEA